MARRKILSVAMATLMTLSTTMGQSNLYGIVPVAHASGQSKEVTVDATQVSGEDYGLRDDIQEGVILHCFDWKYSDIKAELPNIAAAGFTAVQTSPAQKGDGDVWYWLYQPQTFSIQGNALGGKSELTELCAEAEKYGIKVIVDVVANHTRSKNDDGMDSSWFHDYEGRITYDAEHRWQIIKGKIGMPDLASEQERVQTKVKGYIEELKSVGVDGIRWDAAKHIGLPSEDCNFWPAVTSLGLYNYGEILKGPCNNDGNNDALMKEYTNYLTVTDDEYGDGLLKSIQDGRIPTSIGNYCQRGVSKDKLIYWAESHDTYSNNGEYGKATQYIAEDKINRTYALLASQGQATALYFSRPKEKDKHQIKAGVKGDAENFKSKQVAAVNHLHNHCVGEKEYYATGNDAAAVCRETGACIVKASGSGQVTVPNGGGLTAPGTYTDEVSGNTFEVTATTISGEVGESGIAVIYSGTDSTKKASVSASLADGSSFTDETVNVTLTVKNASSATYSVDGGAETTISGTANVTVGAGLSAGQKTTITVKMTSEDGETSTKTFTYTKKEAGSVEANTIYATKPSGWSGMYIYIYEPGETVKKLTGEWPGVAMTDAGDGVYTYQLSSDVTSAKVIFNDGNGKQNPENVPGQACGFDFTGGKAYTFDGSWAEATIQQPATAAPVQTSAPVVSDPVATTAPTQQVAPTENGGNVSTPTISVSQAEGTEFKTETLDVKVTLSGVTQGSYSVDNGPEKTFTNSATVTLGQGLIGDKETTLKVNAGNVTKTFTYKKVFDASTSVVKSSAISRIQSIAEIIADLVQVNAGLAGEPASQYFSTNPGNQTGAKKTITSAKDFTEDMIIAQGVANDNISIFRGSHEGPVYDSYALFGAYDDTNIYLGLQYTNVIDVVDPAQNFPQSDNGEPGNGNIPQMMVFDTRSGDYTDGTANDTEQKTAWDINVKFAGAAKVDKVFVYSAKPEEKNTALFSVVNGIVDYNTVKFSKKGTDSGITYKYEKGFFCSKMFGINGNGYNGYTPDQLNDDNSTWVDFLEQGHDVSHDSMMIMTIPMSALGVDANKVATEGIGVMSISTFGASGIGSCPQDLSMLDIASEPYSADKSTSAEKEDTDIVTTRLAQLGGTVTNGGQKNPTLPENTTAPVQTTSVEPTQGVAVSPAPDTTTAPVVTVAPTTDVTEKTVAPITSAAVVPTDNAGNNEQSVDSNKETDAMVVNFGADLSAPQAAGTELTLKAIPYNVSGNCEYQYSIDGQEVEGTQDSITWKPEAGVHEIAVTVTDQEGKTVTVSKQYTVENDGSVVVTAQPETGSDATATDSAFATDAPNVQPGATTAGNIDSTEGQTQTQTPTPTTNNQVVNNQTVPNARTAKTPISAKMKFTVAAPQKVNTEIGVSPVEVQGGSGSYTYKLVASLKDSTETVVIADAVPGSTVTLWKPEKAGTYELYMTVTDSADVSNKATVQQEYKITAASTNKKLAITKAKVSKKKIKLGKKIKITAAGTASKGTLKFKFSAQNGKKTTVLKKYNTKKTYTWKPKKAGTYKIIIQAKDGSGKTVKKTLKVVVKK